MKIRRSHAAALLLWALLAVLGWQSPAAAQGVTTSALGGTITGPEGQPLQGVQVTVRNAATGTTRSVVTDAGGRYFVGNLLPGGPYTVTASRVGYGTQTRSNITLVLSQTATTNIQLQDQAVVLEALTVSAEQNPVINRSRTGAGTVLGSETVEELPTLNRSFSELATASPYVVAPGGESPSVGGTNNRYNNIQIDGATTSDIFGLGSSGTPGGQGTAAKPVPLDAIDQFQVLVSPFDVRQTGFTGGLINAVTKSGTNEFHGSAFFMYRDEGLIADDTIIGFGRSFAPPTEFFTRQFGLSLGGPIVRDRLHFFFAGEWEQSDRPETFSVLSDPGTIRVTRAQVDSVINAANARGLNLGTGDLLTQEERLGSFLGRLDYRINDNHRLVLRHNSTPKWRDDEGLSRGGANFDLTSYNFYYRTMNNSTVLQLFSQLGEGLSNELLANYQTIRDRPTPEVRFSALEITATGASSQSGRIRAGAEVSRQANELDQDIIQVTNNLTLDRGAHRLTFGANVDYYDFRNLFLQGALGTYRFASPTTFAAGTPSEYEANVPLREDINARFSVMNPGVYLQDVWSLSDAFQVTAGLRVDMPYMLDDPETNTAFVTAFDIDNAEMPSGNPLISPRVGFNYQVPGSYATQIRGGVGVFTGRPPFVWLSNVYGNTGNDFVTIRCTGAAVPDFTPTAPPSACRSGSGAQPAQALVNYADPDFKFPQDLKATLGIDRELPFDITATLEAVYTRGVNVPVVREINLVGPQNNTIPASAMQGLGDREIYGTPQNNNRIAFNPVRVNNAFRHVIELTNAEKSEQWMAVAQLSRQFGETFNLQASYTWLRARDPISLTSSVATSNMGFHPIGARVNDFSLAPSSFERPHKITLVGTANVLPQLGGTEISAIYVGQSGRTYSYTYDGDINGDGYESTAPGMGGRNNDLVYIPANISEIAFRTPRDQELFQQLVDQEECLRENRGKILPRNACRGPWTNRLDVAISQGLPISGPGEGLELELNIFNFLNLINGDWGLQQGPANNTITLLDLDGRVGNVATGAPVFTYDGFFEDITEGSVTTRRAVLPYSTFNFDSRYQLQLGVRYRF